MEIVLLGHMGRDEAAVDRLEGHRIHVLGQLPNPGLVEKAEASGGEFYEIDSIKNRQQIADIVAGIAPDMFLTNFDDSLAAGVVDAVRKRVPGLLIPSPDRAASRVEWDKFYLREIIDSINSDYNPVNFMATTSEEASEAIDFFEAQSIELALKPRNLTGGKGVKVMGKHFDTYSEARAYAREVISADDQSGIEIQEKLEGHEFTLQIFTDGTTMINPPATYDYPYREDGDVGPGTGGMGAFTMPSGEQLPFITEQDYDEALTLAGSVLAELKQRGYDYKGVLYPSFFKTAEGLKIVEINARGGDPELINILDLMEDDVDYGEVLRQLSTSELQPDSIRFKKMASAMIYLVSPEYGYRKGPTYDFGFDPKIIAAQGCKVRFAAAKRVKDGRYSTVGSSRTIGLSALGSTPWEARGKILDAIAEGFDQPFQLQYRREVAEEDYIKALK